MKEPQRQALVALVATLAIQIFTSLAATAPAVLAPALAPDLGITPKWIGVFVSLVYAGAMLGSLGCAGFIARYGAIRVSQASVLLCAIGLAFVALLPGSAAPLLAGAAFVMGVGYGPITPASSDVLIRTTPNDRMGLTFSIKQTGVPAGAALAGAILPGMALLAGWRGAFVAIAVLGLIVIAAAQPTRRTFDVHHRGPTKGRPESGLPPVGEARSASGASSTRPTKCRPESGLPPVGEARSTSGASSLFSVAALIAPLKIVLRTSALRELSLVGFAFAAVQVCLSSFLVVYLEEALHWSLVAAGLALTCATLSAVIGRICWGMLADQALGPNRVLAVIGAIAALCGVAMAFATPGWPVWVVLPLAALYGASAIGWNGVQLSELARRAPPGTAGAVTGASGFVTFGGIVVGPLVFAGLAGLTDSYRIGFLVAAAVSGIAAWVLLRRDGRPP